MTISPLDCALRRERQDGQQVDRRARIQPPPTVRGILNSPSSAGARSDASQPIGVPPWKPDSASPFGTLLRCLTLDSETNELMKDIDLLDHEISNTMTSLDVAVAAVAQQHASLLDSLAMRKTRLVFVPGESLVAQVVLAAQTRVKSA